MNVQSEKLLKVVDSITALKHIESQIQQAHEEIYIELVDLYHAVRNPRAFDNMCRALRIPSKLTVRLYQEVRYSEKYDGDKPIAVSK
jgi:hypothetical protein